MRTFLFWEWCTLRDLLDLWRRILAAVVQHSEKLNFSFRVTPFPRISMLMEFGGWGARLKKTRPTLLAINFEIRGKGVPQKLKLSFQNDDTLFPRFHYRARMIPYFQDFTIARDDQRRQNKQPGQDLPKTLRILLVRVMFCARKRVLQNCDLGGRRLR